MADPLKLDHSPGASLPGPAPGLAFLFPGQGSQRAGMLASLRGVLPGYTEALSEIDGLFPPGESLLERVHAAPTAENDVALTATQVAQPALGLVSLAAAVALLRLGLRPSFSAGHSYGELPALAMGGAFDAATLIRLSLERGRILAEASLSAPGGMLALVAGEPEARSLISGTKLVLANINSPRQIVVAGGARELEALEQRATREGVRAIRLRTSCAFHSPAMAKATAPWRKVLEQTAIAPLTSTVMSNVTASAYPGDAEATRKLLAAQPTEPVRWGDEVLSLYEMGARIFIEVGPGEVLTTLTRAILGERPHVALPLDPGKGDARTHLRKLFTELASRGVPVDAPAIPPAAVERLPVGGGASFFDSNRRALEAFFAGQERVIAACAPLPAEARKELFDRLVAANERAFSGFLATQARALGSAEEPPAAPTSVDPREAHPAAPAPPSAPAGGGGAPIEAAVIQSIAELTGFPADLLGSDRQFERDLGVDSVTMVEVYFKLVEKWPGLEPHASHLRACRTVGELVSGVTDIVAPSNTLQTQNAAHQEPPPARSMELSDGGRRPAKPDPRSGSMKTIDVANASGEWLAPPRRQDVQAELLRLLAKACGRTVESLEPKADVEADLGIDPFTREDIVHALIAKRSALRLGERELLHARTVQDWLEVAWRVLGCVEAEAPSELALPSAKTERFVRVFEPSAPPVATEGRDPVVVVGDLSGPFERTCAALALRGHRVVRLPLDAGRFRVDERGGAVALDDAVGLSPFVGLHAKGATVLFLASAPKCSLADQDASAWTEDVERGSVGLFTLAKALSISGAVPTAIFVVVSGDAPALAGARGVARSLSREWPTLSVRSVAVLPSFNPEDAGRVLDVVGSGPAEHDLVMEGGALLRARLERRAVRKRPERLPLDSASLVLLLGGGDGITAEATVALAEAYRCRFVAVGRTPFPRELPFPTLHDEKDLTRALFEQGGPDLDAAELRTRLRRVVRQRAMWRTRERIESAGGAFAYVQADARDAEQLESAIRAIRAEHGPIHGAIHGAGVTSDALVIDKTYDDFRRVLHTKVQPAFALYKLLRDEPLAFAMLFSSLSAHAGTPGQTDYVAANEVLEAVARRWNREVAYPVRAILWSVWSETGLASPALLRQMDRLGLGGITNEEGRRLFVEELAGGSKEDDWVLLSPPSTLEFVLQRGGPGRAGQMRHG